MTTLETTADPSGVVQAAGRGPPVLVAMNHPVPVIPDAAHVEAIKQARRTPGLRTYRSGKPPDGCPRPIESGARGLGRPASRATTAYAVRFEKDHQTELGMCCWYDNSTSRDNCDAFADQGCDALHEELVAAMVKATDCLDAAASSASQGASEAAIDDFLAARLILATLAYTFTRRSLG